MTAANSLRVLDAPALLAIARGDTFALVVIDIVLHSGGTLVVPSSALAAAIASRPSEEPRLLALTQQDRVEVDDLTNAAARKVGRLLARNKLPIEFLPAAQVVLAATDRGRCSVLSGDPSTLRRVDPDLTVDKA